jgi:hypothetical protein
MLSSKYGKAAQLRLTHRLGGATRCPKAGFLDSLISVLHTRGGAAHSGTRSSHIQQPQQQRRVSLLYVPDDGNELLQQLPAAWQQVPMLQLRPLEHAAQQPAASGQQLQGCGAWPAAAAAAGANAWPQGQQPQPQQCPGPFPLLERFIGGVCNGGGVQGEARSWLLQPGPAGTLPTVVLNIRHNRWCGNVGRPHKSNGIYMCGACAVRHTRAAAARLCDARGALLPCCAAAACSQLVRLLLSPCGMCAHAVDLGRGVYCQRCYDPECRHYRSQLMPLPADAWQQCTQHPLVKQQQQQQQQQGGEGRSAPPAEDVLCLQLLLQFEAMQQQQQQQRRQQQQQQQQRMEHRPGGEPTAGADTDAEDDQCMQLLLDVEAQLAARAQD